MTTGFRNSSGVDFDSLFDPYVQGTPPANTGHRTSDGVDLAGRFAPIVFGSKGPDVGFRASNGQDVSNLWAAIGTATYSSPLPIDGNTYTQSTNITSGNTGYAEIGFKIVGGNTWQVFGYNSITATTSVLASGSVPSGAVSVQYAFGTPTVPAGRTSAGGSTTNGASTATALSSNPQAKYTTATNTATSGSRALSYPFTIDFSNGSGSNISHTAITLVGDTEGSI